MKAISTQISAGIRSDPEIVLLAAFNSENPISGDCQDIIDEFLRDNSADSQEVVSFRPFNLKNLIRSMKNAKSGAKTDVDVNLLQWGDQKEPYYSVYGKVSCADGRDAMILRHRKQVYEAAKQRHPERWTGSTRDWELKDEVWLNSERNQPEELRKAA